MKKIALAAIFATFGLSALAPAQSDTMMSGPWMMRKSTGDKTNDRLWFIADRTLNASEKETLRTMFRNMKSGEMALQAAIVAAIDNGAKMNTNYNMWSSNDWMSSNGMSDIQVYDALQNGLNWTDRGAIIAWREGATTSQMMAVTKLVQRGGWANTMWTGS